MYAPRETYQAGQSSTSGEDIDVVEAEYVYDDEEPRGMQVTVEAEYAYDDEAPRGMQATVEAEYAYDDEAPRDMRATAEVEYAYDEAPVQPQETKEIKQEDAKYLANKPSFIGRFVGRVASATGPYVSIVLNLAVQQGITALTGGAGIPVVLASGFVVEILGSAPTLLKKGFTLKNIKDIVWQSKNSALKQGTGLFIGKLVGQHMGYVVGEIAGGTVTGLLFGKGQVAPVANTRVEQEFKQDQQAQQYLEQARQEVQAEMRNEFKDVKTDEQKLSWLNRNWKPIASAASVSAIAAAVMTNPGQFVASRAWGLFQGNPYVQAVTVSGVVKLLPTERLTRQINAAVDVVLQKAGVKDLKLVPKVIRDRLSDKMQESAIANITLGEVAAQVARTTQDLAVSAAVRQGVQVAGRWESLEQARQEIAAMQTHMAEQASRLMNEAQTISLDKVYETLQTNAQKWWDPESVARKEYAAWKAAQIKGGFWTALDVGFESAIGIATGGLSTASSGLREALWWFSTSKEALDVAVQAGQAADVAGWLWSGEWHAPEWLEEKLINLNTMMQMTRPSGWAEYVGIRTTFDSRIETVRAGVAYMTEGGVAGLFSEALRPFTPYTGWAPEGQWGRFLANTVFGDQNQIVPPTPAEFKTRTEEAQANLGQTIAQNLVIPVMLERQRRAATEQKAQDEARIQQRALELARATRKNTGH